jgi:GT2 family glycosyltransferase
VAQRGEYPRFFAVAGATPVKTPIWVTELELTRAIDDFELPIRADGKAYQGIRVLVRLNHIPLGYAELTPTTTDKHAIADAVWQQLGDAINNRIDISATSLGIDGLAQPNRTSEPEPFISVVMCTRNRPQGALRTLLGLLALDYERYEIVLVDNAPNTDETMKLVTRELGGNPRVKYVREMRPGLSCARNRGVKEAKGDVVAFTDDDVHVDRWWLRGIARGFAQFDEVGCVTGLIPSASLENDVHLYFDKRVTWGSSCETRVFDMKTHKDPSPLYPYSPGLFGTGANFAMRKDVLQELDGFDEALGAGSPCGGGEDVDIFVRTLLAGHKLVYEPSAIISHVHRTDLDELRRQMFAYGSGMSASLMSLIVRRPSTAFDILRRTTAGVTTIHSIARRTTAHGALPSGLVRHELHGMLVGPWQYVEGRQRLKKSVMAARNASPQGTGTSATG